MIYTKLGNSNLNVSRICMGCMGFGDAKNGQHSWTIDEELSRKIIKKGLDLGVNFFDTAIVYQNGTSEQYVGKILNDLKQKRCHNSHKIYASKQRGNRRRSFRTKTY